MQYHKSLVLVCLLVLGMTLVLPGWVVAEETEVRAGYVDLELVLENYEPYVEARSEMEALSREFHEEMEGRRDEIEQRRAQLEEADMLGPQQQQQLGQQLMQKMQNFQLDVQSGQQRLESKQEELLAPVRDTVQNAVREVALENNFDIVHRYDLEDATVLWVSDRLEVSDQVIEKLRDME